MKHLASAIDSTLEKPWYKQFWPWFLIVLPSAAVIASFITLGIAIKYADTPVQGDYEKHGLTVLHKTNVQNSADDRSER